MMTKKTHSTPLSARSHESNHSSLNLTSSAKRFKYYSKYKSNDDDCLSNESDHKLIKAPLLDLSKIGKTQSNVVELSHSKTRLTAKDKLSRAKELENLRKSNPKNAEFKKVSMKDSLLKSIDNSNFDKIRNNKELPDDISSRNYKRMLLDVLSDPKYSEFSKVNEIKFKTRTMEACKNSPEHMYNIYPERLCSK